MSFRAPRILPVLTVIALTVGFSLVFFWTPNDADQGFIQKIFYLHVPIASCALIGFIVAAVQAIMHLRTREPKWDVRAYVSIHISVIFGVAALLTGAIWAKASWGQWWVWDEPTLVSFLIVFLLYCTYYPLRYAIEDRERQARYASVFAVMAGRLRAAQLHRRAAGGDADPPARVRDQRGRAAAEDDVHVPGLLRRHGAAVADAVHLRAGGEVVAGADQPPAPGARGRRRGRRRLPDRAGSPPGAGGRLMPALPLDEAGKYVAAAYLVFLALLLIYVAIMAARLARVDRELGELAEVAERKKAEEPAREQVPA